nr:hypothetical protein [Pectobacterium brasiliense]
MSADQVGLSSDGIPVNDPGDYAVYPNGMGDPENLEQIFVTQGSSEMDGPTSGPAAATSGWFPTVQRKNLGGFVKQTFGSNNLSKTFARLETGQHNGFSIGSPTRIPIPTNGAAQAIPVPIKSNGTACMNMKWPQQQPDCEIQSARYHQLFDVEQTAVRAKWAQDGLRHDAVYKQPWTDFPILKAQPQ